MKQKITNRLGLPQAIVHAVANDPYTSGIGTDYSITGLLKPPRIAQLSKEAEVTEDAADRLYALQGQVMHGILERAGDQLRADGYVVERRFYKDYEVDGKIYRISAQIDIFDPKTGTLSDYKYTSVRAAKYGLKEDHRSQLNVQAELLRTGFTWEGPGQKVFNAFQPQQAEVILMMRDWTAEKVYDGYPTSPTVKQVVPFMPSSEVDAWIVERVRAHEEAKKQLPLCSDEDRWNRPTYAVVKNVEAVPPTFAVMKSLTAARATRILMSRSEAETYIAARGGGLVIVERPGAEAYQKVCRVFPDREQAERYVREEADEMLFIVDRTGRDIRCLRYCPARFVCEQAKKNNPELAIQVVDEDGLVKVS